MDLRDYEHLPLVVFHASVSEVDAALRRILGQTFDPRLFRYCYGHVDVGRVFTGTPTAGSRHPKKLLAFETAAAQGHTVFVANVQDGWVTLALACSEQMHCNAFRFVLGCATDKYPAYRFERIESGTITRSVMLLKDGSRWQFAETGFPLPEEHTARYANRGRASRLDREALLGLADRLGLPIRGSTFWTSTKPGLFVEELPRTQGPTNPL